MVTNNNKKVLTTSFIHGCYFFQVSGRVVTSSQQKPSKTVTARVTARPDMGKAARSNLQVLGVAPPMSSVIVERHHPVTQVWDSVCITTKNYCLLFFSFT